MFNLAPDFKSLKTYFGITKLKKKKDGKNLKSLKKYIFAFLKSSSFQNLRHRFQFSSDFVETSGWEKKKLEPFAHSSFLFRSPTDRIIVKENLYPVHFRVHPRSLKLPPFLLHNQLSQLLIPYCKSEHHHNHTYEMFWVEGN